MFELTRRADYALRTMLSLAGEPAGSWLPAARIARSMAVPRPFLHKITADLVSAGLVRTHAGPKGGLALARPAPQITIGQILEAVDGPVCLNVCLVRPRTCPRAKVCPAHTYLGELQSVLRRALERTSLGDLAAVGRRHPLRSVEASPIPVRPQVTARVP